MSGDVFQLCKTWSECKKWKIGAKQTFFPPSSLLPLAPFLLSRPIFLQPKHITETLGTQAISGKQMLFHKNICSTSTIIFG